jgi:tetratricopeptide (TPR) repeat protein
MKKAFWAICIAILTWFGSYSFSSGYTATDYYNAGLQLYNAQNYPQAIQYFGAALSLDPNNAPALQGRGNCYYVQGRYAEALADYQKVQTLSPSDGLAKMIQSLQARVGQPALPAAGAAAPPGAPSGSSFDQGVDLYQQKQYQQAIPLFQQAVRDNPNDGKAYYYLGLNQMMTGDLKEACLSLTLSDQKLPNPSVKQYAGQLKTRLSPDDQQWVDNQLASGAGAGQAQTVQAKKKKWKVRFLLAFLPLNLSDFNANALANETAAKSFQGFDNTIQYNGSVPSGTVNLALEADLPISPQFELGLSVAIMPAGTASDNIHNGSGSFSFTDSFNLTPAAIGVVARYFLNPGDFQPWLAAGPLLMAGTIQYNYDLQQNGETVTFGGPGSFSGIGFGGQAQVGVDWHLNDAFAFSVFAGYMGGSSSNYQATLSTSNVPNVSSGSSAVLTVVPTSKGNQIVPVANGVLCVPTFDSAAGTAAPPRSKPMVLDTSGPEGGLAISFSW